jgi:hypothetical protein
MGRGEVLPEVQRECGRVEIVVGVSGRIDLDTISPCRGPVSKGVVQLERRQAGSQS